MPKHERKPALHGDALRAALAQDETTAPFLVDHLLNEEASFMLSSDGAAGKSTISIAAAAAMSSGLPVFGQFMPARPLSVYIVLGERTAREPLRRLRKMAEHLGCNPDNLWISDAFSGSLDLRYDHAGDDLIDRIRQDVEGKTIDVLMLEPIYPLGGGR